MKLTETNELSSAMTELRRFDDLEICELSNNGIQITVKSRADKRWRIFIVMIALGAVVAAIGWLLPAPSMLAESPFAMQAKALPWLGVMLVFLGVVFGAAHLANGGPARDIVLCIEPGRLRADRTIAGDRVMREYGANEIAFLTVGGGMICAYTEMGATQIVNFGPAAAMAPLTLLISKTFWKDQSIYSGSVTNRTWIPTGIGVTVASTTEVVFVPESHVRPTANDR